MPIRTLEELRDTTRRFSDTEGKLLRHPDASVDADLNASLTRLRELVSRNGHTYYMAAAPFVSAVDPGTPYQDEILGDVAIDVNRGRLYALILKDGEDHWQLDEFTDVELAHWKNQEPGPPIVFRMRGRVVSPGSVGEIEIEVYPVPDKAYVTEAYFLLEHIALEADDDPFDDPFAWAEWACADAAQKLCLKDNDRDRFALNATRKAEIEAEILRMAPKQQRARVPRRRNTRVHRMQDNWIGGRRYQ